MQLILAIVLLGLVQFNAQEVSQPTSEFSPVSGTLSTDIRIQSKYLGYALQYRVYTPHGYESLKALPVIYLTDGQWYISQGQMVEILDELISLKKIPPIIAVFIDNRDPDKLTKIRRNSQFLCNPAYVDFISNELVTFVDRNYKTIKNPGKRAIMGISFGGLNAAYFGLNASNTFGSIGMQSPALHPCPSIYKNYENQPKLPLKIFLSTGAKNDTEKGTRQLKDILVKKGYQIDYHEVNQEHNWQNWRPLIDDALIYFFSKN